MEDFSIDFSDGTQFDIGSQFMIVKKIFIFLSNYYKFQDTKYNCKKNIK